MNIGIRHLGKEALVSQMFLVKQLEQSHSCLIRGLYECQDPADLGRSVVRMEEEEYLIHRPFGAQSHTCNASENNDRYQVISYTDN